MNNEQRIVNNNVMLFAYCLIALLPVVSNVQVSDTTGDEGKDRAKYINIWISEFVNYKTFKQQTTKNT